MNNSKILNGHTEGIGAISNNIPNPVSEIEREIAKLHDAMRYLGMKIGALGNRLGPVLHPEPPKDKNENEPNPSTSLGVAIRSEKESACISISMIEDFIERLSI